MLLFQISGKSIHLFQGFFGKILHFVAAQRRKGAKILPMTPFAQGVIGATQAIHYRRIRIATGSDQHRLLTFFPNSVPQAVDPIQYRFNRAVMEK